jgi:O-antigen chain-terminating methyltransferase
MTTPEETQDDALDVEQIMAEIRQEIAQRQQDGELAEPDLSIYRPFQNAPDELETSQRELNTCWDQIYEPYEVRSRIPLLGRFWAAIRRRFHGEVRAYLDPMIWRQTDFNAAAVRSLNVVVRELYGGPLARNLQAMNRELLYLRKEVQTLRKRLQQLEPTEDGGAADE